MQGFSHSLGGVFLLRLRQQAEGGSSSAVAVGGFASLDIYLGINALNLNNRDFISSQIRSQGRVSQGLTALFIG